MSRKKIITSEYVSYAHPDKLADRISDALLDCYIQCDADTRAGIETMVKDNVVVLGGEVNSCSMIDVDRVVRLTVDGIYPENHHLSGKELKIINLIGKQSSEISKGVDKCDTDVIGAGDQGFVVGFASNETKEYLPLGVYLAREICNGVTMLDKFSDKYIGPDVKTQVCVEYGGRRPRVKSIVVSAMHSDKITVEEVRKAIEDMIKTNRTDIFAVMDDEIYLEFIKDKDIEYYINVNGAWTIGGPIADCGLTGRKIVVDQYGGYCNVGGGCFSGKDMTKVDRSGAYMARYIAKNIVDAGLADSAKVEISYIISDPNPCALKVELQNPIDTKLNDLSSQIEKYIKENIDLTPSGIIDRFFPEGVRPIFENTARNGHFGFNYSNGFWPWEKMDFSDDLKEYIVKSELELK